MKSSPLSTELQALGFVSCQRISNIRLWGISLLTSVCRGVFCVPLIKKRKELKDEEEVDEGHDEGAAGHAYLFMLETLPVVTTQSARVPISDSLPPTIVCVTEEAAGWVLTGCCGTVRRLWHLSWDPKRNQLTGP